MEGWSIGVLLRKHLSSDREKWYRVAGRLGYSDVTQAMRLLEKAAETGKCPKRIRTNLAAAMGISWVEVEQALRATDAELEQERLTPTLSPEERILLHHADLIIANTRLIVDNPQAYFCRMPGSFSMFMAGVNPTLGELLLAWKEGLCLSTCPTCTSLLRVLRGYRNQENVGMCLACHDFKTLRGKGGTADFFKWKRDRGNQRSNWITVQETYQTEEFHFGCGLKAVTEVRPVTRQIVKPFSIEKVVKWLQEITREQMQTGPGDKADL